MLETDDRVTFVDTVARFRQPLAAPTIQNVELALVDVHLGV